MTEAAKALSIADELVTDTTFTVMPFSLPTVLLNSSRIFFNSFAYNTENNLEISAFLKYINTKIPTNDFTKKLNNLVEESKINNKFRNDYLAMNLHDRDIRRVALAEGREQGAEQTKIETAKKLISMGLSLAQVAEGTGLPLEKVQELANNQQG